LPQATLTDLGRLTEAFKERYEIPELMKFKSAKEIFSRRQQIGKSVDDYAAAIRRLARIVQVEDKVTRYAILNGFLSHIAQHVVSMKPDSLDAVLEAARVPELTNPTKSVTEEVLTKQLADDRAELKLLASKWDKLTTAPVFDRQQQTGRSPSPRRKVTFAPSREQSPVSSAQYNNNFRTNYTPRPAFTGNRTFQGPRPRTSFPSPMAPSFTPVQGQTAGSLPTGPRMSTVNQCPKCGRNAYQNYSQCPAINKFCALCGRRGHFIAVCRLAQKTRQMQQSNE